MNVMFANGIMYFEEHLSQARLKEKYDPNMYLPSLLTNHSTLS